jgi:UDP-glucose 4-epimerase
MKANIWGANGYIGRHLAFFLHSKGWDLTCFDIQEELAIAIDVPYHQINITDKNQIKDINHSCDYLFYFVGLTGTTQSFSSYEDFVKVNEIGLLNVLDSIKDMETKPRVIFPSTRLVYKGQENVPLKEDSEKEFKTIYASSKYNGELYLKMYNRLFDIDYSIFRICVPYGNIFDDNYSYGTIGFFIKRSLQDLPIPLYGDGQLKRTFTHVQDICSQIIEVISYDKSSNTCFNIKGETFSLFEVAELIAAKNNVEVTFTSWPDEALKLESGDTIFDSSKIEKFLEGKSLQYSIHEWLKNYKK